MIRTCKDCRKTLPIEKFGKHRTSRGGRLGYCRSCEWARRDPVKRKAAHKRYRLNHLELWRQKQRLAGAKRRANVGNDHVSMLELRGLLSFYGERCVYCGGPYENLDHGTPLSRGGRHLASNLFPSCETCNKRKGIKTIAEFGRLPVIRNTAIVHPPGEL